MGFRTNSTRFLIVSAAQRLCALNLAEVVETFRPLPIASVAGAPGFVLGLSIVRGHSVAVVDLCQLLEGDKSARTTATSEQRMVSVRLGERTIALLVDAVLGVRTLDAAQLASTPGLMGAVASDLLSTLGQLDEQLLVVLRAGRLVPSEVWTLLGAQASRAAEEGLPS
jgi:purine-binding chemotaxis protein CheW